MIRDFTDSAKAKLLGIVDEVSEQWCVFDFFDDLFSREPDIQNYLNNLDHYHRELLDTDNLSKDKIDKIFTAVEQEDDSFRPRFEAARATVQEQTQYIKQLKGCMSIRSGFSKDDVNRIMKPLVEKIDTAKVAYNLTKLKQSNGDYNYDYIKELMEGKPEDIPPELYAAMVIAFNEMSNTQKEKFIETAYLEKGAYTDPNPNSCACMWRFEMSDVFGVMVEVYRTAIDQQTINISDITPEQRQWIGNYSLLHAVWTNAHDSYTCGTQFTDAAPVKVTIKQGTRLGTQIQLSENVTVPFYDNDYSISFNGPGTPYSANGVSLNFHNQTVYSFGLGDHNKLDNLFSDSIAVQTDSVRVDITTEQVKNIVGGAVDLILCFVPMKNIVSAGITVAETVGDCVITSIEGNATNETINLIQAIDAEKRVFTPLHISGSCSIGDNGPTMSLAVIDKTALSDSLQAYQADTGTAVSFSPDTIQTALGDGTLGNVEGLQAYLDWYNYNDGETKTAAWIDQNAG